MAGNSILKAGTCSSFYNKTEEHAHGFTRISRYMLMVLQEYCFNYSWLHKKYYGINSHGFTRINSFRLHCNGLCYKQPLAIALQQLVGLPLATALLPHVGLPLLQLYSSLLAYLWLQLYSRLVGLPLATALQQARWLTFGYCFTAAC
jgi:hypothetical protein